MTIIKKEDLVKIARLFDVRIDEAYITLYEKNGFKEIIQYSAKYDNVHIAKVKAETLDILKKPCLD